MARVARGFATAEENKEVEQTIGVVPIDSLFSPVRKVKYVVENTRVGQHTDYDVQRSRQIRYAHADWRWRIMRQSL